MMIAVYISFSKYFHGDNKITNNFLNILLFIHVNEHRCRWSKFLQVKVATNFEFLSTSDECFLKLLKVEKYYCGSGCHR